MINFDTLPKERPNQNTVSEGRYNATVFDAKMMVGKTSQREYLNVSFQLDGGGFVNENYFESDKPFLLYKLGRLLEACNVKLEGEGSLKDIAKVVKGKKVIVDVAVNDNGYGSLDYTGDKEGIYPASVKASAKAEVAEAVAVDPDITNELEQDPYEDF